MLDRLAALAASQQCHLQSKQAHGGTLSTLQARGWTLAYQAMATDELPPMEQQQDSVTPPCANQSLALVAIGSR